MTALPLIPFGRKSSGEDDTLSRERQERATTAWAAANGEELAPFVWEPHVSGSKDWRRRGLGEALARVERGEAAGIVVEEQSRLSRENMRATAEVWEAFESSGARLVCTAEGLDTARGDHELSFSIRAALAREQWKQYARRMEAVKRSRIEKGIPVGRPPVGYRKGADKTLELDPVLAPVVRELYERRVAGAGWTVLADLLGEATGRTWTRQGAAAVIANRIYATGRLEYGGVVSEVDAGAIVDEPLWHAAQAAEVRRPSRSGGAWLLTGLVRCASCTNALVPWTGAHRRRQDPRRGRNGWVEVKNPPRRYRCTTRSCQARASVDAPRLERWVVLVSFAAGDELVARDDAPDLGALEDALATAERRLAQVLAPEAQDALGDAWAPTVKARRVERDAAATELGQTRQESGVAASELRLRDVWDRLTPEERREAVGLFWKAVRVGQRGPGGTPVTLVARGPHAEAEVELT